MNNTLVTLSKWISCALRHTPEKFGIKLDNNGFAKTQDLLDGINSKRFWKEVTLNDIKEVIAQSDKKRFELSEDEHLIRAVYGHSTNQVKIELNGATPPDILYHGTTMSVQPKIQREGILPMKRQYVHLSDDKVVASIVGQRHGGVTVIFKIDARKMLDDGFRFGTGNDHTWMTTMVPPKYIVDYAIV